VPGVPAAAIALSAALLLVSTVAGYIASPFLDSADIASTLKSTLGPLANLSPVLLFVFIFINNAFKAALAIALGVFFGIFPVVFLVANGLLLGLVVRLSGSPLVTAAAILPHGIIEIPAIIVAAAMGMYLGSGLLDQVRGKQPRLGSRASIIARAYVLLLVPAFLAAAAIEAFLTPLVVMAVF